MTELSTSASKHYEPDMYLRGEWYIVLDVLDASGISSVTVKKDSNSSPLSQGSDYFVDTINIDSSGFTDSSTTKKGKKVFIPIEANSSSASVKYTVTAIDTDGTSHTATQTFSFNIDNTAPSLENITANGATFSSENLVQNSHFKFTLGGKSTDEGSGVERVVFYYMRKNGTTKNGEDAISIDSNNEVILDPMVKPTGDNYSAVKVSMNDATNIEKLEIEQDSSHKYELYAQKISGTATATTFSGTLNDHVRVGGLVTFDKTIYRRITEKTDSSVTFEPALTTAPTGTVTAYFPIAQVIDNSASEKTSSDSANPFTFESGKDDGDLMPESFSKSGKTWSWDASIHSDNLPDGPASLVILAFDEAGNVAGTTINTFVSNNAPRLAKVFLGTDLSGDGKYINSSSLTEIVEYDILGAEGATQSSYTLDFNEKITSGETIKDKYPNGVFKIMNGLAVIPELTGGNGLVGMVFNSGATDTTAVKALVTNEVSDLITCKSDGEVSSADGKVTATFSGTVAGKFTG